MEPIKTHNASEAEIRDLMGEDPREARFQEPTLHPDATARVARRLAKLANDTREVAAELDVLTNGRVGDLTSQIAQIFDNCADMLDGNAAKQHRIDMKNDENVPF